MSARDKIRDFFLQNVGKVITTQEIRRVAGISEYARRIRELRDEEGFRILSHKDRTDLKPGQYLLETIEKNIVIKRSIPLSLRNEILARNGYTCKHCGATAGDPDPYNPGRKLTLHIDHDIPISQGGKNHPDNLRTLCSACNQGKSNIQPASENARNLLARIRRSPMSVQREVYEALKRKFERPDGR